MVWGAWRNFQSQSGEQLEGVVIPADTSVDAQTNATVEQRGTQVTAYAAQTALPTPMAPSGIGVSVYGEDAVAYLTPADIDLGLAEDSPSTLPNTRNSVIADEPSDLVDYTEVENGDGTVSLVPADGGDRQIDVESHLAAYEDVDAEGPLGHVEGHTHSAIEQAGAMRWEAKIIERATEVGVSEEAAQALANELLLDYTDLIRMRVEKDQVERRQALAQLRAEYGSDLGLVLEAVEQSLTTLPNNLGEVIVSARTRTGERLINVPGIAEWIIQGATHSDKYIEASAVDVSRQYEQAQALMLTDIDTFRRERKFGPDGQMTGSEFVYWVDKNRAA